MEEDPPALQRRVEHGLEFELVFDDHEAAPRLAAGQRCGEVAGVDRLGRSLPVPDQLFVALAGQVEEERLVRLQGQAGLHGVQVGVVPHRADLGEHGGGNAEPGSSRSRSLPKAGDAAAFAVAATSAFAAASAVAAACPVAAFAVAAFAAAAFAVAAFAAAASAAAGSAACPVAAPAGGLVSAAGSVRGSYTCRAPVSGLMRHSWRPAHA